MNIGEKVKGTPANPVMRSKYPVVIGYYNERKWDFGDLKFTTEFVKCGTTDVDCDFIEPASRREKETVLS